MTQKMNGSDSQFRVTVKARMYHGVLHETMNRLAMSRKEFASYIGIRYELLSQILNMKHVPNFKSERGKMLKQNLEDLTGVSISELFPGNIFTEEFLGQDKSIQVTRDVPSHLLANASAVHQLSLPPDEIMIQKESKGEDFVKILEPILNTLSARDRLVIQLRFFEGKTYSECIPFLNVNHPQSVRQIEAKVLRRLREPMRIRMLRGLSQHGHIQSPDEVEFNRWLTQTIVANSKLYEIKPH